METHFLMIGLEICGVVSEKPDLPDPCRLIDHTTDDDRREGIRRYFADCPETTDEDVELVLRAYNRWESEQNQIRRVCEAFVVSIVGGRY